MVGFNVDDKVFGKVKGYPAWPARITSINGKRYGVVFYGTNETATLKQDDIFYYLGNKNRFPMQKRKFYAEAVTDIELDIANCGGSDGNPNQGIIDSNNEPPPATVPTKGNKRKRNSMAKKSSDSLTPSNKRVKLEDQNHNLDESHIQEQAQSSLDKFLTDTSKSEDPLSEATKSVVIKEETVENQDGDKMEIDSLPEETVEKRLSDTSLEIKKTSDSGDKNKEVAVGHVAKDDLATIIEPKITKENPYYSGELNVKDINLLPEFYLTAITLYAERVQLYNHHYKITKPDPVSLDDPNDKRLKVLPVKMNGDKYCGLIYAPKSLDSFKSEFDRAIDDAHTVQELLELKAEINVGNFNIIDHRFIKQLDCDSTYVQNTTNLSLVAQKKSKLEWLQREMDSLEILLEIKKCLGLKGAKTNETIALLQTLLNSPIAAISMKKHTNFVDTVISLTKYVGNCRDWMLGESELEAFEKDARTIRTLADKILAKVRGLFDYGAQADAFRENFEKDCEIFNQIKRHMTEAEVYALCAEPLSRKAQLELIFDEQAHNSQHSEENSDAEVMYTPD